MIIWWLMTDCWWLMTDDSSLNDLLLVIKSKLLMIDDYLGLNVDEYLFPFSSSSCPERMAANPVAPAPSTMHFSVSTNLRIAIAIHSSLTTTNLSIKGLAVTKALYPTIGTAKPSAKVEWMDVKTGFPFSRAKEKLGHRSDSTPYETIK